MIVFAILAGVIGYYSFRLFQYQILNGQNYVTRAVDNSTRTISLPTTRGLIYDRNGVVLARNVPSYDVVITPADLPNDPGEIQQVYRELSALINVPVSNGNTDENTVRNFTPCQTDLGITQIVYIGSTNAPYDPVQIKCYIDQTTAMEISEKAADLPGVSIQTNSIREYPTGESTADVVGFLGPIPESEVDYWTNLGFIANRDKVGYAGVENSLNDILTGRNGQRVVQVDNSGKIVKDLEPPIDPVPGNSVQLTIDVRLQNAAQAALVNEMNYENQLVGKTKYTSGVVIAMNPQTGEILAMVSYPSYENNRMARVIPAYYYEQLKEDPLTPLLNRAISGTYPPGSVFKMSTAVGIINEGVVTPDTTIFDPGVITIDQKYLENDPNPQPRKYVCWIYKDTGAGHGEVNYLKGIAQSCDVYFYMVGGGYKDEIPEGLGIWRIGEYARAVGYGKTTGIELPGEAEGLIPDPVWKRTTVGENWSTGDTYISTIGQGYVLATPLQVLNAISTIANGGKLMKPTLVENILDSDGNIIKPFEPQMVWDVTKDPEINIYDENFNVTGQKKTVDPYAIQMAQEGMREVVTSGTAETIFDNFEVDGVPIQTAGKTGTAEYCDDVARAQNLCSEGLWPSHAWYVGYAPYQNPEIAVVAFVYNGDEGATLSAPIVREVIRAYYELKSLNNGENQTNTP